MDIYLKKQFYTLLIEKLGRRFSLKGTRFNDRGIFERI